MEVTLLIIFILSFTIKWEMLCHHIRKRIYGWSEVLHFTFTSVRSLQKILPPSFRSKM